MDLLEYQVPVTHSNVHHSFSLKRNARIKSKKLPSDFFNALPYTPFPSTPIIEDNNSRDIRTPSFRVRGGYSCVLRDEIKQERKVETARPSLEKQYELDEINLNVFCCSQKLRAGQ